MKLFCLAINLIQRSQTPSYTNYLLLSPPKSIYFLFFYESVPGQLVLFNFYFNNQLISSFFLFSFFPFFNMIRCIVINERDVLLRPKDSHPLPFLHQRAPHQFLTNFQRSQVLRGSLSLPFFWIISGGLASAIEKYLRVVSIQRFIFKFILSATWMDWGRPTTVVEISHMIWILVLKKNKKTWIIKKRQNWSYDFIGVHLAKV